MSLSLSNVILHQLKKDSEDTLQVNVSDQSLPHSSATETFISELHSVYSGKASKGFGQFSSESDFARWLQAYRNQEMDFQTFSKQSAARLRDELAKYPFADEGLLVFAEYNVLATDYLFIGMLATQNSMQVTPDLTISSTEYLDVPKMDIAAQINLSTLETEPTSNRYLTYIKGRVGRKIADFFLDFMQAEIGLDTKLQNKLLMQHVEEHCEQSDLDKTEKQAYRQKVYDYCTAQVNAGEEIVLKDLANELPKNAQGQDLYQYAEAQVSDLEESFPGDKSLVRKLTKFVGAGGGSLSILIVYCLANEFFMTLILIR